MILGDIASFVAGKIGMTDAATLAKLKSYAAQRYALICADALWKDLLSVYTKSVAAGAHTVILPGHVSDFVEAKYDQTGLIPVDQAFIFRSYAELWDDTGTPSHVSELAPIATKVMPLAAGEILRFASSNGSDVGNPVQIHGEDVNGEQLSETVLLNGASWVQSVNNYVSVFGLSKGATQGTVTVTGSISLLTLATLKPTETQKLHRRIRLHTIPGQDLTLLILAKRHPGPFTADADATQLPPKCDQALLALVHGDALEWQRQYSKAQIKFGEGLALLATAKKDEVFQRSQVKRITPGESLAEGCNPHDFL
jgi:hypothetical protein